MPDTKITTKEAIMLIISIIVAHTIVTLPATLLKNSESGAILNLIYESKGIILNSSTAVKKTRALPSKDGCAGRKE